MATPPARAVELTVAKNRHGDTGKVGLIFRPDRVLPISPREFRFSIAYSHPS
jgi:hypothetical protein